MRFRLVVLGEGPLIESVARLNSNYFPVAGMDGGAARSVSWFGGISFQSWKLDSFSQEEIWVRPASSMGC